MVKDPFIFAVTGGKVDASKVNIVADAVEAALKEDFATSGGDKFWDQSADALIRAEVGYLLGKGRAEDCTVAKLREMSELAVTDREEFNSLFEAVRDENAEAPGIAAFDKYSLAPEKTAAAIASSVAALLAKL